MVEVWGGIECTINRVEDRYLQQLSFNGHLRRDGDLDLVAQLGIKVMRYPLLWEQMSPDGENIDWSWAEARLSKLRELNIRPVVGLIHHGSGPRSVSLLHSAFVDKFSSYVEKLIHKFPWLDSFTPINEPLTTARFSGLYGLWYPHGRDNKTFVRCLLTQCKATIIAMQVIRNTNPRAQLLQTEDLAKVHSTPTLRYQARFENERRWLSFDLLCGRVLPGHPLWNYLTCEGGATEEELLWFVENHCSPDLLGLNYYVTSERFLDHRADRYPVHTYGGNGRHTYADVEAARVPGRYFSGPQKVIKEAWQRYRIPIVLSEVHLGSHREEQLRWFSELYNSAENLRRGNVDVRAVVAWSLLGSYHWNTLLTRDGAYESGVFDVRSKLPRPTALAHCVRTLTARKPYKHPVLCAKGWWHRHRPLSVRSVFTRQSRQPIAIVGARGRLGHAFARICEHRAIPTVLLTRDEIDIFCTSSISTMLREFKPWAVINATGYVRIDQAEQDCERCHQDNSLAAMNLAEVCGSSDIPFATFSSDFVFDGYQNQPYVESDTVNPLNVYGRTQVSAEQEVLARHSCPLIVRTSSFFGPWDGQNFLTQMFRSINQKHRFQAANDVYISPTYIPDLVHTVLDLLIDGEFGLWHLTNKNTVTSNLSWAEFGIYAIKRARISTRLIEPVSVKQLSYTAARPKYSALNSERAMLLPSLDEAIDRYLNERAVV